MREQKLGRCVESIVMNFMDSNLMPNKMVSDLLFLDPFEGSFSSFALKSTKEPRINCAENLKSLRRGIFLPFCSFRLIEVGDFLRAWSLISGEPLR